MEVLLSFASNSPRSLISHSKWEYELESVMMFTDFALIDCNLQTQDEYAKQGAKPCSRHVTRCRSKKSRLYWQITCWWSGNTSADTSSQHWLHLTRICRLVCCKQWFIQPFASCACDPAFTVASWTWRNWMFMEKHTVVCPSWNQQSFPADMSWNHCIVHFTDRPGIVQLVS